MTKVIIESTSIAGLFHEIQGMDKDNYSKIVKSWWTEPYVFIAFVFFMLGDEDNNYWAIGLTFLVLGFYRRQNYLHESSYEDNSSEGVTNKLS